MLQRGFTITVECNEEEYLDSWANKKQKRYDASSQHRRVYTARTVALIPRTDPLDNKNRRCSPAHTRASSSRRNPQLSVILILTAPWIPLDPPIPNGSPATTLTANRLNPVPSHIVMASRLPPSQMRPDFAPRSQLTAALRHAKDASRLSSLIRSADR